MATAAASTAILSSVIYARPSRVKPLRPTSPLHSPSSKKRALTVAEGHGCERYGIRASDKRAVMELSTASDALASRRAPEVGLPDVERRPALGLPDDEQQPILGDDGSPAAPPDSAASDIDSTLNRLSKWIVAAIFGIAILWKHDAEALWLAAGSVINSVISVILKRMFNHQRPAPHLKPGPGMPSSHAQSIFYCSTVLILSLVHWMGINGVTVALGTFAFTCSSYFSWLRVSQQFHTPSQVSVGALVGSACAAMWFWSWQTIVLKAFISSIWVRAAVVLGSVLLCVGFVLYVISHWLKDD